MLDRAGLEIAIGVTLTAAIILGWGLHALWRRLSPTPASHSARMAVMAARLHEAEEARDAAVAARAELEERLAAREAEHRRMLDETESRLSAAFAEREAELKRELWAAHADRDSSVEGLRLARERIAALEADGAESEG